LVYLLPTKVKTDTKVSEGPYIFTLESCYFCVIVDKMHRYGLEKTGIAESAGVSKMICPGIRKASGFQSSEADRFKETCDLCLLLFFYHFKTDDLLRIQVQKPISRLLFLKHSFYTHRCCCLKKEKPIY